MSMRLFDPSAALECMRPRLKVVFYQRCMEGMTFKEIAQSGYLHDEHPLVKSVITVGCARQIFLKSMNSFLYWHRR